MFRLPLLASEESSCPSAQAVGHHLHNVTQITSGDPPETGVHDFDYCFVFPLPSYYVLLKKRAQGLELTTDQENYIKKLAHDAEEELKQEDKTFRRKLEHRGKRHAATQNGRRSYVFDFSQEVLSLFKDMFFETEHAEGFDAREIVDLESARAAAIDLLLGFFRRDEERYYTHLFSSVDEDEIFLCVRMLDSTAVGHAVRSNYPLQISKKAVKDEAKLNIRLSHGPDGPNGVAMVPAYAEPDFAVLDAFKTHRHEANPEVRPLTRKVDNIRLLYDRVTDILDLDLMMKWGLMKAAFPLHTKKKLLDLQRSWANPRLWWSFDQPLNEIRDYFGETVALYFAFMQHICIYTAVNVVFGLAIMLGNFAGMGFSRKDILGTIGGVYGPDSLRAVQIFLIVIWSLVFQRHLARKYSALTARWNCRYGDDSEVKSFPNPSFAMMAHLGSSDVDLNLNEFIVPYNQRRRGRLLSAMGTIAFIFLTLFAVGILLYIKAYYLVHKQHLPSLLASYGVTVQIKVADAIWEVLGNVLTDFEYHKEMRDYDSSIAIKSFYVSLINLYSSFIYIAFFMQALGDDSFKAVGQTPWQYLTYQMITTFGLYMFFTLYDLIEPLRQLYLSTRQEFEKLKKCGLLAKDATDPEYSFIELQAKMQTYSGQEINNDYLDVIGVFGFVACFGVTFPIGSAIALVYIMLQTRVDGWKLTRVMRRSWPELCKEDWDWEAVMTQFLWMAIFTNLGLLVMYLEPWRSMDKPMKAVWFFGLLLGAFVFDFLMKLVFPSVSQEVDLAARRRRRQIYQLGQYKKKKLSVAGTQTEEHSMWFHCCGDQTFFHVPGLTRKSSMFEDPVFHIERLHSKSALNSRKDEEEEED